MWVEALWMAFTLVSNSIIKISEIQTPHDKNINLFLETISLCEKSIHVFIQLIFIELLLCAKYWASPGGNIMKKITWMPFGGLINEKFIY